MSGRHTGSHSHSTGDVGPAYGFCTGSQSHQVGMFKPLYANERAFKCRSVVEFVPISLLDDYTIILSKGAKDGSSIAMTQTVLNTYSYLYKYCISDCPYPTCHMYISQQTPVAQLFMCQTLTIGLLYPITSQYLVGYFPHQKCSHDYISELLKTRALKRLCHKIHNHICHQTPFHSNFSFGNPISDKEVPDVDVLLVRLLLKALRH